MIKDLNNIFEEMLFKKRYQYTSDLEQIIKQIGLITNGKNISQSKPSVYSKPPYDIYPIDYLASFAVLGLDVKITPENDIKIIEMNGILSGMKGFKEVEAGDRNSSEQKLQSHLDHLGREPLAYIAARLILAGHVPHRIKGGDEILIREQDSTFNIFFPILQKRFWHNPELRTVHPEWRAKYGHLAETLIGIEKTLKDKWQTDQLFERHRKIKPKTDQYTEENFRQLAQAEQPKYIVIKPVNGNRGEGLVIVPAIALPPDRPAPTEDLVIEPFIPSKPIYSAKDGQFHDGCMRYVLFVEEDRMGGIELHHFGGYWRLCPHPISDDLDIDGMRANLAQGAIANKVSPEDIKLVKATVERDIPTVYQKLVWKADPSRRFNEFLKQYSLY